MSIPEIFINRPIATTLINTGMIIAGALAFNLLPVSPLPQVDYPTISVNASLPGASPENMATSVATPLERQFAHISGVTEMTSTSNLGTTSVTLQFDLSRDIDGAARDVQAAINAARSYLPAALPSNPTYRKVNPADAPILILALTSDRYTTSKMYDVASSVLQQELSQVDGVGQVIVGGSSLPAVRAELNPNALSKYGISLNTVASAIGSSNVNPPKGKLGNKLMSWEIKTNDQMYKAEQYKSLIIAYQSGRPVRLSDIADVQDSVEDVRNAGFVNGSKAVVLIVFRQPGANIISTVDKVLAMLPTFKALIPAGVDLTVALDRTPTIRASLSEAKKTIIFSILLVIGVVYFFLRNARTTFIPSTVVPISLVSTFGVMYLLHFSLNNISLMALTIATGFVVDDSIVVVENITRHLEKGETPLKAAIKGVGEIAFTITSISISLVAVFTPILLMAGILGRLFREFAVTLSVAILISLLVSLTTTPMLCALLLKQHDKEKQDSQGRLFKSSQSMFDWMYNTYEKGLSWSLRHPKFVLSVTIGVVFLNIVLFYLVPKGFFPQQDTGRLNGSIQASQDVSFQLMQQKLKTVVGIIQKDPAVETVTAFTGGGGSTRNTARMFVALKAVRKLNADQLIARLRKSLSILPATPTYFQSVQDVRVGGRMSNAMYQYTLRDDDLNELMTWAPRVEAGLHKVHQLVDISSDQQNKGLQTYLDINHDRASSLGITSAMIDSALYGAFGQRQVSIMYTPLNQYHVVMEVEPKYWQRPDVLNNFYVISAHNARVPLSSIATFRLTNSSLAVNHQSEVPAVTISFNLTPGASLGDAVSSIESATKKMMLPASIRGTFQGTAQAFQTSIASEPYLILAALVAVYIVLGILYESYIHPITILSTLPSAGVGALLSLLIFRIDLSVIAMIGMLLLIGIVKKNGIIMIDFAIAAERNEGKTPFEAIYQASLLRFRPIMMTTASAMFGAMPLAFRTGMGSELRRPLGITIIGGLMLSQMLTLFTTPVIYLWMDRYRIWLARVRGKSEREVLLSEKV
jgi:multidrug efflux pump